MPYNGGVYAGELYNYFLILKSMAVLDLDSNGLIGENGTGKLYLATDYDGATFADGTGSNSAAFITTIEADYTFADVGLFENFGFSVANGEERIINTDYCGIGEVSRKAEKVTGFTFDLQDVLEMTNLAQMLGTELETATGVEIINMKRVMKSKPYQLFKFETCPKDGKQNVFYFVKAVLSGDVSFPLLNLDRTDFAGVTFEYEVANGGNMFIQKGKTVA